jgi:16S rRNA (guanine527-N7)-methyltransferase
LRAQESQVFSVADREPLRQRLDAGLSALGIALDEAAIARLLDYVDLLERWNAAYNLTAVRDPAEMVTRHLVDSLAILPHVSGATLADLGSGAGLPGIPLAIAAPTRATQLVDSNGKKARFLREAVRRLDLKHVRVAESRVEDVTGTFDCITARAFASLGDMLGWGGHLLTDDGIWLAMKGRVSDDELAAVPADFRVEKIVPLNVPGLDAERHLVIVRRSDRHA